MAGYSEKDIDTEEDDQWNPPTEAEMKVIEARRERSDRISKIMGSYLLKGYKMLATECAKCGTINLQDKQGKLYCVACEEVDPEIQKDNPALSEEAASSKRAEQQFSSERNPVEESRDHEYDSACATFASRLSSMLTETSSSTAQNVAVHTKNASKRTLATALPPAEHKTTHTHTPASFVEEECVRCLQVVNKKLCWARQSLESETDPDQVMTFLKVITHSVEAVVALKKIVH